MIYYNFISDGTTSITNHSYSGENGEKAIYINRWDRLDYTKANSGERWYNLNAMRYYGEYTAHMYAWFILYPFHNMDCLLGKLSNRAKVVDFGDIPVTKGEWYNSIINIILNKVYDIFGILGV